MALDPALAAVRLAVRRGLALRPDGHGGVRTTDVRDGGCVLVACSGGADSLALLTATVFEAARAPFGVVGVVVDHGLQDGSAALTADVVQQMASLGVDETASIRVTVDPGPAGVEAGAREARYAALGQLAQHFGADRVLLGHTQDDQAETVLLGLARGSGGRSIAGMRRAFDRAGTAFVRPLLDVTRAQTEAACRAQAVTWWDDPHNADPRFVRSRVRHTVLPLLEQELGPGVGAVLARTADGVREDVLFLDDLADRALADVHVGGGLDAALLGALPTALAGRVVRLAALEAGALASDLSREHVQAVGSLVTGPRDDRRIRLPGHLTAYRDGPVLRFGPTDPA